MICIVSLWFGLARAAGSHGTCFDPVQSKLPLCGNYVTFPYTSPYPEVSANSPFSLPSFSSQQE